ncbi:MsnO8 family LLM class oxidoreductase [Vogesella sp. DC21W]|uniref:MsnO8 family LLM class oxidoreductase n=1 Tax=Vogesella aquatica TaxID=2984206 RepID=A0ABT5J197_9NEIS|nr:MsnO8 family LLM class oxidoreductase [Vogesella aquatica]MDC7718586.1 MsnO8 family LLM class oxidoreductase [Vogesella aquatica]
MAYLLSLLDKSPQAPGLSAAEALAATVAQARLADDLGYHRFWLAEHHNNAQLASSAPEVLIAYILARTSRIRVGSGGVMLQHYSPFKVAEVFNTLANLAPGRVDLGIGKAPGGLPLSSNALQRYHHQADKPDFAAQLAELVTWLEDSRRDSEPAELQATPLAGERLQGVLLGGSPESAALAARYGWDFAFAGHFNGDPANLERSIDTYRQATGRVPALALYAFAAESREAAQQQVGQLQLFKVTLPDGRSVNVPTREAAAEYARQAGSADYRLEEKHPHVVAGTAADVHAELARLQQRYGIGEFILDNPVPHFAARRQSIALLAQARQPALA